MTITGTDFIGGTAVDFGNAGPAWSTGNQITVRARRERPEFTVTSPAAAVGTSSRQFTYGGRARGTASPATSAAGK